MALETRMIVRLSHISRLDTHPLFWSRLLNPIVLLGVHVRILLVLPGCVNMTFRVEHLGVRLIWLINVSMKLLVILKQTLLGNALCLGPIIVMMVSW